MKTIPHLLWLFLLGISLQSCMHSTTLQVLQPADMRIPEHLTTIATIDRSKPSNGFVNVLEGLFTGETIGQDKRGRLRALDGLTHSLTRTPRFQVKPTDIELEGTNTGNNMAPPLPGRKLSRSASVLARMRSWLSNNTTAMPLSPPSLFRKSTRTKKA
ncbi:MAG: hypothetical protein IPJ40_06820 [Saprospirales bacterium]|nr:hypothetical protein [Saprospirales bacterium]